MLPGKKYAPEDFVRIAWRRKWLLLIPALLAGAGTFLYSQSLPDRYRSATTVLVIPQRVPPEFVRSTVTDTVAARLNSISQQILSRTRLERIIEEFNLYERERETMLVEDIVEQMRRRDIRVDIVQPRGRGRNQDASSFTVSFESSNPRTAMQVAERLASMFVQENLEGRELLADSTNQFLRAQLDEARRRLVDHEAKLEAFRRQHAGRLPSQLQSNFQMLQSTQVQLQTNASAASQERDRLAMLEAAIAEAAANPGTPGADPVDGATGTAAQQLESARASLRAMELRLKPEHPDVIRAKRVIGELEAKAEVEALDAALSPSAAPIVADGSRGRTDRLTAMQLEAREIRARLEGRKQEEARLQSMMASYTARLEAAPGLESELTELMRDYSTLETQYKSLLGKSEAASMAVNLERRQVGEQFRVIDAARLPQRPTSPDRQRMNLLGLMAGLGFGLALVALLEYRDTRLQTDDDVVTSLALPVLAVIPRMISSAERQQMRRRKLLLGLSGSAATAVVVVAVVAWRMELLEAWVR
jgi:polysaccharide chain length determinant protein (PEP-CTERM system associated)